MTRSSLIVKIEQTIHRFQMIESSDRVLVGVSGGIDSVALLHVLIALAERFSIRIGIAHLNHCLRGKNSDNDAQFVESLANNLRLPCYIWREDIRSSSLVNRLSLEEAGRTARYAFFENMAQQHGFHKIAIGHHANDQAELVLMNLFRGSGAQGLSGIPPVREGKIIRPLIEVTRYEIMEFITQNHLAYVTDESNTDETYLRNRIRHHLIPLLQKSYNPNIVEAVNQFSAITRDENEWIEEMIIPVFKASVVSDKPDCLTLSVPRIYHIPAAAKRRIIRKAILHIKGDLRRIAYAHIEAVVNVVEAGTGEKMLHFPDRIRIRRTQNDLMFIKEQMPLRESDKSQKSNSCVSFLYKINNMGTFYITEIGTCLNLTCIPVKDFPGISNIKSHVAFFDCDVLKFPLIFRNVISGDRFCPLGMTGKQKINDYFINTKMPKDKRLKCAVLTSDEEIIWVAGHRTSEFGKVTESTRNVLKAELVLA